MRRKALEPLEEAQMNLTPLLDVVFVILIMFILAAPFLEIDKVMLASGPLHEEENVQLVQESSPITLHVYADNSICLNQKRVSLEELGVQLKIAKELHPTASPQVFHDKSASFGTYQSIKNVVEGSGFSQMDVILKPE